MTKAFIYRDREGASRLWQKAYYSAAKQLGIPAIYIDFDNIFDRPKSPRSILKKIRRYHSPGDKFIARFNERRELSFKPLYPELESIFGQGNIFPDKLTMELYNNKRLQADLFNQKQYPTPHQAWIENESQLNEFMHKNSLSFPIVRKESKGSASTGVSLLNGPQTQYPFLAQEFCANNTGDIRVMVVGNRVFGFARENRPNDFRASGSGKIRYIEDLPVDCIETAYLISHAYGFRCMAYDFIKNNSKEWAITEISYTFASEPPSRCSYYYDANRRFEKITQKIGPVARLILLDICASDR